MHHYTAKTEATLKNQYGELSQINLGLAVESVNMRFRAEALVRIARRSLKKTAFYVTLIYTLMLKLYTKSYLY